MWIHLFRFLFLYLAIFLLRYYMRNDKIMCPVVPSAYWFCGFFGVRTHALIILLLANAYTRRRQIIWWLAHAHSRTRHYFVCLYEHEILMWAALQHKPLRNIVSFSFLKKTEQLMHLYLEVCGSAFAPLERANRELVVTGDGTDCTAWQ